MTINLISSIPKTVPVSKETQDPAMSNDPPAHSNESLQMGIAAERKSDYQNAAAYYKESIDLFRFRKETWINLIRVYEKLNKLEEFHSYVETTHDFNAPMYEMVASIFKDGSDGVPQSPALAVQYYQKALDKLNNKSDENSMSEQTLKYRIKLTNEIQKFEPFFSTI